MSEATNTRMTLHLPSHLVKEIKLRAVQAGLRYSQLIEQAVVEYLESHPQPMEPQSQSREESSRC